MGTEEIQKQLAELGYESTLHSVKDVIPGKYVVFKYTIPHGKFRNIEIEVALHAPQFPLVPPSGPYINPHLLPITGGGGKHPYGAIHKRDIPTKDFQYWSRPFNEWNSSEKSMKAYLGFLRTLFDFE